MTTTPIPYLGYTIVPRVYRTAYARNGNAHNPTQYWCYDVYRGSRLVLVSIKRLKDAKLAICEMVAESQ